MLSLLRLDDGVTCRPAHALRSSKQHTYEQMLCKVTFPRWLRGDDEFSINDLSSHILRDTAEILIRCSLFCRIQYLRPPLVGRA